MMHAAAPGSIQWEDGEVDDINLIQVCLILHKTPAEIEAMNPRHVALVLDIHKANDEIQAARAKKKRSKGRG